MTQSLNNTAKAIIIEDTFDRGELFGNLDCNLKLIEEHLGVVIIQRDNMLTIKGDKLETAEKVINELMTLIEKGEKLDTQKVTYIIDLCKQGISYAESHMDKDIVCYTHMGKPLKPKTLGQKYYIKSMRNKDVVFGIGPAGTGKTYLAVAMAVKAFKAKEVSRIVLTRPAVEAGEKLGFLPGDLQQKVDPYLRPLYDGLFDMLGAETYERLVEKQIIEVAPLAYMRGRTLDDSFIILDEAQNTTPEQMKMFLTRMGVGSKVVVTGDVTQIDLPERTRSGLVDALHVLKNVNGIAQCYFTEKDVVRHRLVQEIIKAYEKAAHPEK